MSAKTPTKPPVASDSVDRSPSPGDSPADAVLEEIRALYDAILPPDVAADWDLATTLYIETHPLMRERLQVMRARHVEKSGEVSPVEPSDLAVKRGGRR